MCKSDSTIERAEGGLFDKRLINRNILSGVNLSNQSHRVPDGDGATYCQKPP